MNEPILLSLKSEPGKKTWLAVVVGRSVKYGLDRRFVATIGGEAGMKKYILDGDALYEACEAGEKHFLIVKDGAAEKLTREEGWRLVLEKAAVAKRERDRQETEREARRQKEEAERERVSREMDERIARFNTEGGFSFN
jgi:KaiC/GvpD/RAD55 family RecA-like ATPase